MLSQEERDARHAFYSGIFGEARLRTDNIFTDHLWPVASYEEKIAGLLKRGFKDPQKMIALSPAILGLSFENIDEKVAGLLMRGFKDPQKMIALLPPILGYSFENVDGKIAGLLKRGFKDPQKMIALSPAILGLSFENIDGKIVGLLKRGFKDPQKMIALSPAILGYSFENVDRKLRLCGRLRVDVEEFISYTIVFIGMSSKHYIPIARKCRELKKPTTPKNVFAIYKTKTF